MKRAPKLTAERAREIFRYEPETGHLIRILKTSNRINLGVPIKTKDRHGYIQVHAEGQLHRAHRVIWLMMTGAWPTHDIDHINMVRDDNSWANLREVSRSQNMANSRARVNSSHGAKGVTRNGDGWSVGITVNGRRIYYGTFGTKESAERAYLEVARFHFGEHARGSE